ncbi:type VI secretion system tip protein TssI/VgrG [Caballeronia sp. LZ019]|uniref:type VI secretion system Vgr family protein n=1 Tax=Caballeronia sp. LZ019 TaxID=3038555 RepID=UPI0028679C4C|nr:type VI secretion system tip protein TssI/VgrG [Caballeronia sp. LZ019]MDR5811275.1 type VI secretion system tip protein TssI/VgrG [Caballeronia sp. LZ019]
MIELTQTRTLGFHCAALPGADYYGTPFLVPTRLHGTEAIGEIFESTITAKTVAGRYYSQEQDANLDLDKLLGKLATVTIEVTGKGTFVPGMPGDTGAGNLGGYTREITGMITATRFIGGEGRSMVYEFTLRPPLHLATLNQESRAFFGKDVIEMTREVLRRYPMQVDYRLGVWGFSNRVFPKRDYQRQAWESDYQFMRRLWEEWGLWFWFEHSDGHCRMVLTDLMSAHKSHGPAHKTLRYHPARGDRLDEECIDTLSVRNVLGTGQVTLRDYDYTNPHLARPVTTPEGTSAQPRDDKHPQPEHYGWGDFAQPLEGGLDGAPNDKRDEARYLSDVRMGALRCQTLRAKGHGHLTGLLPGYRFSLVGYPQQKANTNYLVVSCTLDIQEVDVEAAGAPLARCDADFEVQPTGEYHRLEQKTPKPCIGGPENAIVVGHGDYEHWLDPMNRVLIQFAWDREGTFDGDRCAWVRVAMPWQGYARGMALPLRVNDEVIVEHVNGDPDLPIIVGSAVNHDKVPAWDLPRNQSLSGIRSLSLGDGLKSNHLALDDTKDQLQAQLASDQSSSILSLGFIRRIFGKEGRKEARGEGFELRTDGHGVARAAKGLLVTTEARTGAQAHATDMGETIARLTQARDVHESMARLAQQHGAQTSPSGQSEVVKSMKATNDALRGTGKGSPHSGGFPEFTEPHLTLASPAGIETTTAGSTHLASDKDLAVTTGRHISLAAARSLFASVLESVAVFAQKAGIALTAAAGKVRIEAQSDSVQVIAKKDAELVSTDGWINLTAAKGVRINGGGTVLEISPSGLVGFTSGQFLVHAADHGTAGARSKPVKMPLSNLADAKVAEHFVLVEHGSGFLLPDHPYRVTLDDGTVLEGVSNELGETKLVLSESIQFGTVEILNSDGSGNALSITRVALTRDSDIKTPPPLSMQKRLNTIGSKVVERNNAKPTSENKYANLAKCSPNNWGMRYSTNRDAASGKLGYPVASEYATAIYRCLIDTVKWGDGYFGKDEKNATLALSWPIDPAAARKLTKLIAPVLRTALASSLGDFSLPEAAFPTFSFESFRNSENNKDIAVADGGFTAARWELCINTDKLANIFTGNMAEVGERWLRLKEIRKLAMTLFHESRHCEQTFWMYAMVQQQSNGFRGQVDKDGKVLPDLVHIGEWPEAEARNDLARAIVALACTQSIPENTAALISIKRMAVPYYLWHLTFQERHGARPSYLSDANAAAVEIGKVRRFALDLLHDTGLGGTAIDIDDLATEPPQRNVNYSGRPWENDAFFTEEVAGCYWDHLGGGELVLPEPDVCSPKLDGDSRSSERLASILKGSRQGEQAK